jgi:hypothetical protein
MSPAQHHVMTAVGSWPGAVRGLVADEMERAGQNRGPRTQASVFYWRGEPLAARG